MPKVDRFEDLMCWQEARKLTRAVYELTKSPELSKDFALRDQLRRAALSSMTNVAEGFARFHRQEFIRLLDIAQGSAAEVRSLLYVVLDQQYAAEGAVKELQSQADSVVSTTKGLIRYLHRQKSDDAVKEPGAEYILVEES